MGHSDPRLFRKKPTSELFQHLQGQALALITLKH